MKLALMDELGKVEQHAPRSSMVKLLDSPVAVLGVIKRRKPFSQFGSKRDDVFVIDLDT